MANTPSKPSSGGHNNPASKPAPTAAQARWLDANRDAGGRMPNLETFRINPKSLF